jgi:hypothetical protein
MYLGETKGPYKCRVMVEYRRKHRRGSQSNINILICQSILKYSKQTMLTQRPKPKKIKTYKLQIILHRV